MLSKSKKDLIKKVNKELKRKVKGKSPFRTVDLRNIIFLVKNGYKLNPELGRIARNIRTKGMSDESWDDDDQSAIPTKKSKTKSLKTHGRVLKGLKSLSQLRKFLKIR